MELEQKAGVEQQDPAIPCPGWICVAQVDQQTSVQGDMQLQELGKGFGVGFSKLPTNIVSAIVVSIGDWSEEFYESFTDLERLHTPYEVGSKVYFTEDRSFEIDGYRFLQWNHVVAYRNDDR